MFYNIYHHYTKYKYKYIDIYLSIFLKYTIMEGYGCEYWLSNRNNDPSLMRTTKRVACSNQNLSWSMKEGINGMCVL